MGIEKKLLNWWWWSVVKGGDDKRIAAQTPSEGVMEINNLDYVGDGSRWHLLDIYRPESAGNDKLPVIIDVHGGGWMYGDKELNKNYNLALASRGFAVISFSYSLFPDVTFPTPVQEIFNAINFTLNVAEKYNLDTDNMFLTGDSAGGHYIGLVASIQADTALQELYGVHTDAKFKALGFTCAAFYPNGLESLRVHLAKTFVRQFYNGDKKYKNNKFYHSVDIANNRVKDFPPMFINSCYNDMLKEQNLKFIKYLDENKIPYELDFPEKKDCVNKMGHVYAVLYPTQWPESIKTIDNMIAFFRKQM